MIPSELGINFNHISAKSLTVLNPLRPVDARIMDDADLAGPMLFCFCFALFLLLVSVARSCGLSTIGIKLISLYAVWKAPVRIHIWRDTAGIRFHVPPPQHDVRVWDRRVPRHFRSWILLTSDGRGVRD